MLARSVCIVRNVKKMKACQSLCKGIDKTHDSSRKAEPIGVFKTGGQRVR
jgi:hypothetical protein